jgi:pseudaminic acid biosynthesis-associated methylase
MKYLTEQEEFWAGSFGSSYIERNNTASLLAANINFFSRALSSADSITSCLEFGSNIGLNLKALKTLFPALSPCAVEINKDAVHVMQGILPECEVVGDSIFNYDADLQFDLALVKGVLIHIDPDRLPLVYEKLIRSSRRYILIAEYYNPTPVNVPYRGHEDRLFKRDFAGEMLDAWPEMQLLDYGFQYHRDVKFPQDDLNWFLLERRSK